MTHEQTHAEMQAARATSPAWMVICCGECDQICGTEREARKEVKDLIKMGCGDEKDIRVKRFDSWQDAEAFEDKLRGL